MEAEDWLWLLHVVNDPNEKKKLNNSGDAGQESTE